MPQVHAEDKAGDAEKKGRAEEAPRDFTLPVVTRSKPPVTTPGPKKPRQWKDNRPVLMFQKKGSR